MSKIYTTPNWGATLPSVLFGEDIELERPPAFDVLANEIEPPDWAVKATCKIGGKRHPKREIDHSIVYHGHSARPMCGPLAETRDEAIKQALARRDRRKQKGSASMPSAKKSVQKGNLREEDYRFWKGYAIEDEGAQCRWCSSVYKGRHNMVEHHRFAPCKEYLLALYKYAKQCTKQWYCFSCKKETKFFRWGIPLCQTANCIANWKFTITEHLHGFLQYKNWAEDAQETDPKNGPYRDVPTDGLDTGSGLYC